MLCNHAVKVWKNKFVIEREWVWMVKTENRATSGTFQLARIHLRAEDIWWLCLYLCALSMHDPYFAWIAISWVCWNKCVCWFEYVAVSLSLSWQNGTLICMCVWTFQRVRHRLKACKWHFLHYFQSFPAIALQLGYGSRCAICIFN